MKTYIVVLVIDDAYAKEQGISDQTTTIWSDYNEKFRMNYYMWCQKNQKTYYQKFCLDLRAVQEFISQHCKNYTAVCMPEQNPDTWDQELKLNMIESCEPWGYFKYLNAMGGKERYDFDTIDEAYEFGQNLRKNIEAECYMDQISVQINNKVVRVNILDKHEISV